MLGHTMKVMERIFIDDMQFGFMKVKGATDTIFIVRQMQEKFKKEDILALLIWKKRLVGFREK